MSREMIEITTSNSINVNPDRLTQFMQATSQAESRITDKAAVFVRGGPLAAALGKMSIVKLCFKVEL